MTTFLAQASTPRTGARPSSLALAVADANWFTTAHLFRSIDRLATQTLLLQCHDYRNAWRKGRRPWDHMGGLQAIRPGLHEQEVVLPPGWMKRFPRLGMRPIARAVQRWRANQAAALLALVMTYPHYLFLRDQLDPDLQIYFNVDDYRLYWPGFADEIDRLERQAVTEADLTICVARSRCEELRASVPGSAARIRHLPHGTPGFALADQPLDRPAPAPADIRDLPRPLLGYIGSLEDRIDWNLLTRLADAMPTASVVLVGRMAPLGEASWQQDCRRCLERPNVHLIGWRPQHEISHYYAAFDVILVPYRTDHPFNQACCPTKLMDGMGSSRPMVVTDLPECRLSRTLIDVVGSPDEFLATVERIVLSGSDDGRAADRLAHARANSCKRVAERLLDWVDEVIALREHGGPHATDALQKKS